MTFKEDLHPFYPPTIALVETTPSRKMLGETRPVPCSSRVVWMRGRSLARIGSDSLGV